LIYCFAIEKFKDSYKELEPLYRKHYKEMQTRLQETGVVIGDYNPRLSTYEQACKDGWLLNFVARLDGQVVGYSNIYVTQDMHNSELIAQEDTIYILPEHRNGTGKALIRFVHDELKSRGVKRLNITTATDLRVSKLLGRMGYAQTAHAMTLVFGD
jgi:L-amino acid N-acyltransferase YncA